MKRIRLYELAKELRLESRQVVADARRLGAMAGSPSSSVDESVANRIRELYFPKKSTANEPRTARLVKVHKPAAAATAKGQTEEQAVQEPATGATETAAKPMLKTTSGTRIIKLAPKPANDLYSAALDAPGWPPRQGPSQEGSKIQ
jgi:translation initiation factor IF-2